MSKYFAEKSIRKIISRNMSKSQRIALENGERFVIHIHRYGKELKKWGWDNNNCNFIISGKSMRIEENSLVELSFKNNIKDANSAIAYFFYGERDDYYLAICAIDNPSTKDCEDEARFRCLFEDDNED